MTEKALKEPSNFSITVAAAIIRMTTAAEPKDIYLRILSVFTL
jgi:hypothetical protein